MGRDWGYIPTGGVVRDGEAAVVFDDSGGSYAGVGWRAGILSDQHFLATVGLG